MKIIQKKLRSQRGISLIEMLVTLVIMIITGIAISTGISVATRAYSNITTNSNAEILCSTLTSEIADELRFAQDISGTEDEPTFTSMRFGSNAQITSPDGRILVNGAAILPDKTYTDLDAVVVVTFADDIFHIELTIEQKGTKAATSTFDIAPINQ